VLFLNQYMSGEFTLVWEIIGLVILDRDIVMMLLPCHETFFTFTVYIMHPKLMFIIVEPWPSAGFGK